MVMPYSFLATRSETKLVLPGLAQQNQGARGNPALLRRVMRGDYTIALNLTGNGLDDPDQTLYENFTCGAEGNYDRYCSTELDKMVDRQSMEFDPVKVPHAEAGKSPEVVLDQHR
jgi:ABC-type oligopeptide transport system substrate-binding subunit